MEGVEGEGGEVYSAIQWRGGRTCNLGEQDGLLLNNIDCEHKKEASMMGRLGYLLKSE